MQKKVVDPVNGYILVELIDNEKTSTGIIINTKDNFREGKVIRISNQSKFKDSIVGNKVVLPMSSGIPIFGNLLIKEEEILAIIDEEQE